MIKGKHHPKSKSYLPQKTSFVTWVMFLSTLVAVLFCLIPVIFPALLLKTFGGLDDISGINPFEIGEWAYPLLVTNLVILSIVVLYLKNRLWQPITKSIKFIFNFEVSQKVAFLAVVLLIGLYISFSIGELSDGKFQPDFEHLFKNWLEEYSPTESNTPIGYHVQFFLETSSMQIFGNYKVIPFISSILLLVLTYIFTVELSQKRFAGIVAMVIVLQSNIFLMYDTSVSYPNFWIFFYLLSLYLILKKWQLSPISWIASVLSKALTAAFLPMTLFFVYRANLSKNKKIRIVLAYGIILALGAVFLAINNINPVNFQEFDYHDLWSGFSGLYFALRFDGIVLVFMLPLIFGLFIASSKGIRHADSIMFLIMAMLLSGPLIQSFTGSINVPYRFVPLIVFFAIGTGLLLSRRVTK